MTTVNVHEAKTHLSRLLARVEKGEEIQVARHGRPIARLVPIEGAKRQLGLMKGKIRIHKDFDDPLPEDILRAFGP